MSSRDFHNYKRFAIKAAKELFYSDAVISELRNTQNEGEIRCIMKTAREEKINECERG